MNGLINNAIFNPNGNDSTESRSMWFGETTNLMQLNDVKYSWAVGLYNQLRENFWIPQKLDITQDVTDYNLLTNQERRAFDGILSYLTFLDSIQTCNLPHLKNAVTAPEVSMCMVEQLSQEAMHNASYQYMIETIIPSSRRNSVYDFWREDKVLAKRCNYIAGQYQAYLENPSGETYFTSLLADYILESLLFYNGFIYFYTLSSRMLMPGSADVFKMINRDELSHVRLFQKMLPEAMTTFIHSTDQVYEMFDTAVQNEILWTNHIIGQDILGITADSTERYTKYLANIRLKAIGLDYLYDDAKFKKSPYAHLERFADTKAEGNTKANFFEAGVTSYSMSSGISGWEF
jgi:ribonucleoside-diphosphate reductase beta chain